MQILGRDGYGVEDFYFFVGSMMAIVLVRHFISLFLHVPFDVFICWRAM